MSSTAKRTAERCRSRPRSCGRDRTVRLAPHWSSPYSANGERYCIIRAGSRKRAGSSSSFSFLSLSLSLSFSFSCVASIAVEADGDAGVLLVRRCGRARRRDAETRTPLVGSATRLGPRRRSLRFAISNAIGWKASQSRCTPRETVPFIG